MASIRKRKGKYQVQVRVRGKGTSATFQTLDHARRWARKIELEFERSIKVGKSYQPKTLLEILDRYKEVVIPLKKSAKPEDIASSIMWFVTSKNLITGETIFVDGGYHLKA